ncbi:hypothetical protein HWD35_14040 [Tsukamurella tyrosinosolvens]|uniref:hypothetical protein n=1 Tax=Tsukamurella tyrosinosolvens TaxID=57704 RepID=UPI00079A22C7|nr:hypothetical protein [Tsukamurella tyrosinosolvens]KXP04332.1 hypothetical protein AXK59_12865 [Tsukamurella tyrosinosolvens]KZL97571.1 hypothetical protein AXX05_00985 [Tsukamurella tyrosinosolvens]MCA4995835.1 hypothetical protein [Tsukamurella tyrosinosolvens]
MPEQSHDPRWVAAANWAAAGGFGVGAIAQREGVTRIDALLAIADEWARYPHLFTRPAAVVPPVGVEQCPECGIWFSDVEAHRVVHRRGRQRPKTTRARPASRQRTVEPVRTGGRPVRPRASPAGLNGALEPPPPGRGVPLTELPPDAPWATWAEAANWAAANGLGPSRLADRLGTDAASVTVAIIDAWSHDPAAFTVPAAVDAPGGALKQCPACGLWFASVDNHVAAHGRISGRRRGSARTPARWGSRAEHDGHAAPRTAFEHAMEREGLLDQFLELRRCVLEHLSPAQFRTRIDATDQRVAELLGRMAAHAEYTTALGDLMRSREGLLDDDGDRVQCHLCGLWMAMLAPHLPMHRVDAETYRGRFGLADDDALASRSMVPPRLRAPRRAVGTAAGAPAEGGVVGAPAVTA